MKMIGTCASHIYGALYVMHVTTYLSPIFTVMKMAFHIWHVPVARKLIGNRSRMSCFLQNSLNL